MYYAKNMITKIGQILLPTKLGNLSMAVFENSQTGKFASALIVGEVKSKEEVSVRIHSSCLTGDVFGSLLCDCGPQLQIAMKRILKKGTGIIIYLDQEGRGIGLGNKILAMELQQEGLDTVDANLALGLPVDARNFDEAAHIIKTLEVKSICLMTNNPFKTNALESAGIKVSRSSCVPVTSSITKKYLKTKRERMGHLLPI